MSETDRNSDPSSKSKASSTGTGASSQQSSLSAPAPRRYNANAQTRRKLRSQYPRGSTENHVEYILVASFDIDRGPVMEHQYPVAITGDEHMLAELMLPDQAHVRNQDWTIFFLHKDTSQEEDEEERSAKEEERRRRRRKRDRAKGVIHESDDEYEHEADDLDAEEDWDETSSEDDADSSEGPPLIYVLNLVNTKQDKTAKRGAVVKAMAICTRHPFLHIYKVRLLRATPFAGPLTRFTAIAAFGPRGVLQSSRAGNAGYALRRRQRDGPVPASQAKSAGTSSASAERQQGSFRREV